MITIRRLTPDLHQIKTPFLVKPERREIIIRSDEHDPFQAAVPCFLCCCIQQRCAGTPVLVQTVEGKDFHFFSSHPESNQAGDCISVTGAEAFGRTQIDPFAMDGHLQGIPLTDNKIIDSFPILLIDSLQLHALSP